jgi:adenylosuccinate synthase
MVVKHSVQINSISGICLTKLDVLDGLEIIKICTGYKDSNGNSINMPTDADDFIGLTPVYEQLPGWTESTVGATSLDQLPENAKAYISRLEAVIEAPIDIVSTGPDRNETIVLRSPV